MLLKGGDTIATPRASANSSDFWEGEAALTETGREVLEGGKDRVEINGIDRWLGGVHLSGGGARWRWYESNRLLRRSAA